MKTIYSPESVRFGDWLRSQREAKGLTMREAGKLLGKPHSFVAKIETGQRRLDVIEYVWYSQSLGFDMVAGLQSIVKQ
ncbi:MAG: helix-turn-helix domain-containing protein [Gammaproteobacteria bacterium]|nr:helix-turn-helix domain-containing protein [Gammaproteobacteria bacterium]